MSTADATDTGRLPLADQRTVWRWIGRTAMTNRWHLAGLFGLFGLAQIVGLIGPRLLGHLVDAVVAGTAAAIINVVALAFVAVLVVEAVLTYFARVHAATLGEHLIAGAREGFVRRVVRLPLGTVERAGTGDLLSRVTSDIDRLDEGMRSAAPEIAIGLVTIGLTLGAMVLTSPLLAAGMLLALPLIVAVTRWYRPRAAVVQQRMLSAWADVQSDVHETVDGARTIEALRRTDLRKARGEAVLDRAVGDERRLLKLQALWFPNLELAYVLPIGAMLVLGGWGYTQGWVTLGAVTAVLLYARALAGPVDEVVWWLDELQVGNAALRRVLGVQLVPAEADGAGRRTDRTGPSTAGSTVGAEVVVSGVRFAYTPEREVLHGVDLRINAGERLAVVGPSGAGKSTLGRLVSGVNVPDAGSVTIGGVEVGELSAERLRAEVVLLTQEQHIFVGTLRDNLALPDPPEGDAFSDERLWEVLTEVGIQDWAAALPKGLDTDLSPTTLNPAGDDEEAAETDPVPPAVGQQLALARVLLANPRTIVLDEATSLLDSAASGRLERSLSAVLAGRTVIAIAHRLHTAEQADRIAVVDAGRIVELGSHAELLAADGSYAALHRASHSA